MHRYTHALHHCAIWYAAVLFTGHVAQAQGLIESPMSSRHTYVAGGASIVQQPPAPPPPVETQPPVPPPPAQTQPPEDLEQPRDPDYVTDAEFEAARRDAVQRTRQYGEPAVDTTRTFLRTVTPLLQRGACQWDFGFQYSIFEADFPTITGTTLTEENVTARRLETPLGLRIGLSDRLQYFANIPIGWQQTELFDGFTERTTESGGVGDLATGFNYLLRGEDRYCPAIISTVDVTMPTGNAADPLFLSSAGMGSGAWTTASSLLMIRTLDPVVVFWGVGYRFTFEDTYEANQIDLGDQILYSCGVGFAANERITLSSALIGSYVTDLELNGATIDGSSFDLARIRMAATIVNCGQITEPFVEFGITDRAPAASLGVVFTR